MGFFLVDFWLVWCYISCMKIKYSLLRAFNKARDSEKDKLYNDKVIAGRKGKQCFLDGCNRPLTHYNGPGSLKLCREHQLMQREYGGYARYDRPYTFWKKDHCEECGHNPSKHNKKIKELPEPARTILSMMMLHVDHKKVGRGDKYTNANGVNHPRNLFTLCQECHMLKTYTKGDHMSDWHTRK